jgi:N-alpha-acetyltransferase 40
MEKDYIDISNQKDLSSFIDDYLPPQEQWKSWTHPKTEEVYQVTLSTSTALSAPDFEACFRLIEFTSSADYKISKDGWKPRSKKKEMRLLDLKYLVVKRDDKVEGFLSFMPTYEDDYPVIYCYEIHLSSALQG